MHHAYSIVVQYNCLLLQEWCRRAVSGYEGVTITNMSSSWSTGLLFCALIHRYRPDILDYASLDTEDWAG